MKVCLYTRVASVDAVNKLNEQEFNLRMVAALKDYEVVKCYSDIGKDRVGYYNMLSDIDKYDMVLFTNIDRISRKYNEIEQFFKFMYEKDKFWVSVNDKYTNTTIDGNLCVNIIWSFLEQINN